MIVLPPFILLAAPRNIKKFDGAELDFGGK